jgi:hypothetical protein
MVNGFGFCATPAIHEFHPKRSINKKEAKMPKLELIMTVDRVTPGTNRFAEPTSPNGARKAVGTIYVTKAALSTINSPRTIKVTIEPYEAPKASEMDGVEE